MQFRLSLFLMLTMAMTTIAQSRKIETESSVTSQHEVMIKGKKVPYSATAGTQPVWAEDGHPIATLFYTYYERTDVKDKDRRPLVISFNGGPG
jgi:carboxypeptidase C (cathepsin A)